MKKYRLAALLTLVLLSLVIISCDSNPKAASVEDEHDNNELVVVEENGVKYWTCGMHPSVKISVEAYENGETKCPICVMDLVPVQENRNSDSENISLNVSELERKIANVKTEEIAYLPLYKEITTVGDIEFNEKKVESITARFPGRVEKMFVDFTGQKVHQGEPLLEIYSPKLIAAQEELLSAIETDKILQDRSNNNLVQAAEKKLRLWGITTKQIDFLKEHKKIEDKFVIYAQQSGTVIKKNINQGDYIKTGSKLFTIADLRSLWVMAEIYDYEMNLVSMNQEVNISSQAYPSKIFKGDISFIEPVVNPKTQTVRIRIELDNSQEKFRPGMSVNADIISYFGKEDEFYYGCPMHTHIHQSEPGLCEECGGMKLVKTPGNLVAAIPATAVIDVGRQKLAYVDKGNGNYERRIIEVGSEAYFKTDNVVVKYYELISGLMVGESVVSNSSFLFDSQTQLSGAAAGAYGGSLHEED
ncbi:MAG: efflux RND transporter periplasmic adaptor subunit [Candidatus Cloacimonetes bacterium]|nr:efflux RND transporter periplasmic adaptor subunit [Candidatus Cloacimonadota bacterium]